MKFWGFKRYALCTLFYKLAALLTRMTPHDCDTSWYILLARHMRNKPRKILKTQNVVVACLSTWKIHLSQNWMLPRQLYIFSKYPQGFASVQFIFSNLMQYVFKSIDLILTSRCLASFKFELCAIIRHATNQEAWIQKKKNILSKQDWRATQVQQASLWKRGSGGPKDPWYSILKILKIG